MRSIGWGIVTASISYLAAERFSDIYIVWYLGLILTLLLLTEIDNRMFLLPDILTVPLLIAGFAYSVFVSQWVIPVESVIGAVVGYVLPVLASAFLVWKNKDAFGGGDIKLLAALGAWLGAELVIYTIILACALFGSYAKGYAGDESDVDLCVCTSLTGLAFVGLIEELRLALHKKVDLLRLSDISDNLDLLKEIMKDGIKIYG